MKILRLCVFWVQFIALILSQGNIAADQKNQEKKTYIVHMDKSSMPAAYTDHFQWYDSSLKSVSVYADMLYTYNNVVHGFSARLTPDEANSLQNQLGILSVLPELKYELHTTRTPEFLGLENFDALFPSSGSVSDVIIGVLDTGIWPELKSYDDTGLGPVPSGWKGECEVGKTFNSSNCNQKMIGARYFSKGYEAEYGPIDETQESKSPRDDNGHGSHTSTTAAGAAVAGASLFSFACGTARGMATHARIAAYKVCWLSGCYSSDILAAMDKAVEDGVNVLSMSIGGGAPDYDKDMVAIGAFGAMEQGILVSCSAGNGGPTSESLSNVAPWITTVGAGTLDRDFPAYVNLGRGTHFTGVSLFSGKQLPESLLPLVYAGNVSNNTNGNLCISGSLVPEKVAGKVVLCERGGNARVEKGMVVRDAGGAGMILANTEDYGEELIADAHFLPSASVGQKAGDAIKSYIASESNPMATISSGGTKVNVEPSPVVAAFSSRGPNPLTPEILKPDLIAPGVNILAGWTAAASPTELDEDKRRVSFNIISGTSMSCPHVSGLAALLKAAHREWSPAMIRSALMTTAYTTYKSGQTILDMASGRPSTPFDYGAGHVDPVAALDPGLVYDLTVDDYIDFLCALNYTSTRINTVTRKNVICDNSKNYSIGDFNYPSFSVSLQTASAENGGGDVVTTVKFTRTLTNVGSSGTYHVSVSSEEKKAVNIAVEPQMLSFSSCNEKKGYTVTITAHSLPSGTTSFGRLVWSDGKHVVGSPIAFSWV
ncbi:Subtilisin-like protease, fibronectin type-III domain [Dillenia turbinata]|uniref:Subtilisin-like protease, fibronectin type-III domain n=1 Tax=Dillenia turbinata TaxID=194707 RepID=A0AAN8W1D2_9MAGN